MPRFFRIVHNEQPGPEDFASKEALGIEPATDDAVMTWLASGIGLCDVGSGRSHCAEVPMIGTCIAELDIVEGGPITYLRTTNRRGHHTLWGDASEILRRVRYPVKRVEG